MGAENPMEKQNQLLNTNPALQPDTHAMFY